MTKIPIGLMYLRLVLGFIILLLSYSHFSSFRIIIVVLIILGLLTDIFDGIIARRLNISSQRLRRMDSSIDQVFWICTLIGSIIICTDFFVINWVKLTILLTFECLTYLVSFVKFKKEVATHAILSKIWTLTIMGALIQVVLTCQSLILFDICFYLGVLTRIEIIGILLILKEWTSDVPGLYHAVLLRQGRKIKRNKLFNG